MSYGGFLPLAGAPARQGFPAGAALLSTGRAAWIAILSQLRPRAVHLPFWCCDAMLRPLQQQGIEALFYPLAADFTPAVTLAPAPDEAVLLVDYFGLLGPRLATLAAQLRGHSIILDQSQAFYAGAVNGCWHFNSLRKFFGVPDGAFLTGPAVLELTAPPRWPLPYAYLIERRHGDPAAALAGYRAAEAAHPFEVLGMSPLTRDLFVTLDLEGEAAARVANYRRYAALLGARNTLDLPAAPPSAPLAYPFLPAQPPSQVALAGSGLFIPRYWDECLARAPASGFELERAWSAGLLPLPVDSRYGERDIGEIARLVGTPL